MHLHKHFTASKMEILLIELMRAFLLLSKENKLPHSYMYTFTLSSATRYNLSFKIFRKVLMENRQLCLQMSTERRK